MSRRGFFAAIAAAVLGAARWKQLRARFSPPGDHGISIRLINQYDIQTDRLVCRFDVLYGFSTVREDAKDLLYALRAQGNAEIDALVFHRDAFALECRLAA